MSIFKRSSPVFDSPFRSLLQSTFVNLKSFLSRSESSTDSPLIETHRRTDERDTTELCEIETTQTSDDPQDGDEELIGPTTTWRNDADK
ncbi:hypothetical protein U1Q18_022073 [Sarracenia purpurea var. burkii]